METYVLVDPSLERGRGILQETEAMGECVLSLRI
jgi:hypothetical protein